MQFNPRIRKRALLPRMPKGQRGGLFSVSAAIVAAGHWALLPCALIPQRRCVHLRGLVAIDKTATRGYVRNGGGSICTRL